MLILHVGDIANDVVALNCRFWKLVRRMGSHDPNLASAYCGVSPRLAVMVASMPHEDIARLSDIPVLAFGVRTRDVLDNCLVEVAAYSYADYMRSKLTKSLLPTDIAFAYQQFNYAYYTVSRDVVRLDPALAVTYVQHTPKTLGYFARLDIDKLELASLNDGVQYEVRSPKVIERTAEALIQGASPHVITALHMANLCSPGILKDVANVRT